MKLSDFVLQPRGPYLFDTYLHPETIPTPLGEFQMEMQVDDATTLPPDEPMLAAISQLREQFVRDLPLLVRLVHEQYQRATSHADWVEAWELPVGLQATELAPLLEVRTLSITRFDDIDGSLEITSRVYLAPAWDEEHGLYFAFEDGAWEQVDC